MKLMKRKQPDAEMVVGGDEPGLVDEALTREVIGAFYKVYNTLGHGFLESVDSRALYIELRRRALRVRREVTVTASFPLWAASSFLSPDLRESRAVIRPFLPDPLYRSSRQRLVAASKAHRRAG